MPKDLIMYRIIEVIDFEHTQMVGIGEGYSSVP